MAGGDNGCGIWLLEVTSNKLVTFPRQNSIPPSASCCWNVTVVITCTVYLVMSTYNYLFFVHSWIVYFVLALVLYSRKHSREKTFANWRKIWFCGENFCRLLVCAKGHHAPKFRRENFRKTVKFAKIFSLKSFPLYDIVPWVMIVWLASWVLALFLCCPLWLLIQCDWLTLMLWVILQSSLVHMWEGLGTRLVGIWPWE